MSPEAIERDQTSDAPSPTPAPKPAPSTPAAPSPPRQAAVPASAPVEGVGKVIAVASGKGGVGKSTVSANLACALAQQGRRVGLLDADVYGPSQPRMLGVSGRPASPDGKTIIPLTAHGVTMMSIGLMLEEEKAARAAQAEAVLKTLSVPVEGLDNPVTFYQQQLQEIIERYKQDTDYSRADWMIGKKMAMLGYASEAIEAAISQGSPGICDRKRGHEDDYVSRTVTNIMQDFEVLQQRSNLAEGR